MNRFLLFALLSMSLSACSFLTDLFSSSSTLARDVQAETYISQGKQALKAERYTEALDAFEMARQREFSQSTTAAIYLSGLAAYYLEYNEIAQLRFELLIDDYKNSRYLDDANYHLGLLLQRSNHPPARLRGLFALLDLSQETKNPQIKSMAIDALRQQLFFDAEESDVQAFYRRVEPEEALMVLEALAYRKVVNQVPEVGRKLYTDYLEDGGDSSAWLNQFFPAEKEAEPKTWFEPDIIRIAVFLPLHLNNPSIAYLDEIPTRSVRALEFYEGLRLAAENFNRNNRKQLYLKVFDTQRDTNLIKIQLRELESLRPQLILGEIYNQSTELISNWAESNETVQVIPFSASSSLTQDKVFTFLANPAAETHGVKLAEYARSELGLEKVSVFTDNGFGAQQLMAGFCQTFVDLGGMVDTLRFDRDFEEAKEEIPRLVNKVRGDGVYIPVTGNEEAASLIVNLLKRDGKNNITLMGSPHFYSRYDALDRDIKEDFQLIFTSSYLPDKISDQYQDFVYFYRTRFNLPPSEEVLQGYDLGTYLYDRMNQYDPSLPVGLDSYLRISPPKQTMHVNFDFDREQSNQFVNIGQFSEEGITILNQ
ncbi:MAG: ABC transporter substrate-binding protein [Bacteroidota bacterium]